jgi:hypothetical protein
VKILKKTGTGGFFISEINPEPEVIKNKIKELHKMFPKIWPASVSRWKVVLRPRHSHFLSLTGIVAVERALEG